MTNADLDIRPQIADGIRNLDDEQIEGWAASIGAEYIVQEVFREMSRRFHPERAEGVDAVIQWEIAAPGGQFLYQQRIAKQRCSFVKGAPDPGRVFFGLSLPDFLRFVVGLLDPMEAFMTGRLRLTGDLMLSQSMESWFND